MTAENRPSVVVVEDVEGFSAVWISMLNDLGVHHVLVRPEWTELGSVLSTPPDLVLWRYSYTDPQSHFARGFLDLCATAGARVYPDRRTALGYDDKTIQASQFKQAGIETPATTVAWQLRDVDVHLKEYGLPVVLKLPSGSSAGGVALVRSERLARRMGRRIFTRGAASLNGTFREAREVSYVFRFLRSRLRRSDHVRVRLRERRGLVLQALVPDCEYDYRTVVIGARVWAFRRLNRRGDFRASGSGQYDVDPTGIPRELVILAHRVAEKLRMQSAALDFVELHGRFLLLEASYTWGGLHTVSESLPGHFFVQGADVTLRGATSPRAEVLRLLLEESASPGAAQD